MQSLQRITTPSKEPPFKPSRSLDTCLSALSSRVESRLVTKKVVNFLHNLRSQLRKDLQALHVFHNLLRPRCTGDDGGHVLVLQAPSQCEVRCLALELVRERLYRNQQCQLCITQAGEIPEASQPSGHSQPTPHHHTSPPSSTLYTHLGSPQTWCP